MGALQLVTALLRQLLKSRAALVAENLALRHQIVILQRSVKRPRLHRRDRIFSMIRAARRVCRYGCDPSVLDVPTTTAFEK